VQCQRRHRQEVGLHLLIDVRSQPRGSTIRDWRDILDRLSHSLSNRFRDHGILTSQSLRWVVSRQSISVSSSVLMPNPQCRYATDLWRRGSRSVQLVWGMQATASKASKTDTSMK